MHTAAEPETQTGLDELEAIFKRYRPLVFRAAYRVTGNESDAEDVLQTVFLRLARRETGAIGVRGVESYLYRSAVNAALDIARGRTRKPSISLDDAGPVAATAAASAPDHALEAGRIRSWLREAVARLSPRAAEIFALRFFEGKDNPEIAEMLETTPSTVAVTLHRARERLYREYQAELGGAE